MMQISDMTDPTTTARTLRPDTLGRLTGRDQLRVIPWIDQVVDELGYDPRSDYVETFWLPVLGPSCVVAARRLAWWLEGEPGGFDLEPASFARCLGLGDGTGRHAPVTRTLARLVDFGMARLGVDTVAIRRRFPPLPARHVERLPERLARQHAAHIALVERTARPGTGR
jgi:hypothetical protein